MTGRGKLWVFDGPDGAGKDTQLELMTRYLDTKGTEYIVVKDPSPDVAKEIREVLLTNPRLEQSTRLFLYMAARAELFFKQIIPALDAGKVVLCNRWVLSTYTYQGVSFSREQIDLLMQIGGMDAVMPDLQIVYLTKRSFRQLSEEDAMGKYCSDHRQQIINTYLELAQDPSLNIRVIWADGKTVEQVFEETRELLDANL